MKLYPSALTMLGWGGIPVIVIISSHRVCTWCDEASSERDGEAWGSEDALVRQRTKRDTARHVYTTEVDWMICRTHHTTALHSLPPSLPPLQRPTLHS